VIEGTVLEHEHEYPLGQLCGRNSHDMPPDARDVTRILLR
jgi:hypothetical protein